ncbi:hypothetical protein LWF05_05445, partial [Clostridioides difficile]|nr:hypothetical protein [Clostridioides difficile]MCE0804450.1 hypothetical protein [Clostridioides difficile]
RRKENTRVRKSIIIISKSRNWRRYFIMNINEVVVKILSERIINEGLNPLKNRKFKLDDITNTEYRKAVEDYINTIEQEIK